jgi:beta-glucosidase
VSTSTPSISDKSVILNSRSRSLVISLPGKLPLTFPSAVDRTPLTSTEQYPGVEGVVRYSEGVSVGYRGYDELDLDVAYPFGHGLSYTTFDYADLEVSNASITAGEVQVTFRVTNSGAHAGREVAQVYLGRLPGQTPTPPRQLAGFVPVTLKPGEATRLEVSIPCRCFSYWDVTTDNWVTPPGSVEVHVGASSRDIRLIGELEVPTDD